MNHVSTIAFHKTWIRPDYHPVTLSLIDSFAIVKVKLDLILSDSGFVGASRNIDPINAH